MGSCNAFLRLSRVGEDGSAVPIFKTEVLMKSNDPRWKPVQLSMQQLCNGDPLRPLLVECFSWNKSGAHELLGATSTSVDALQRR